MKFNISGYDKMGKLYFTMDNIKLQDAVSIFNDRGDVPTMHLSAGAITLFIRNFGHTSHTRIRKYIILDDKIFWEQLLQVE